MNTEGTNFYTSRATTYDDLVEVQLGVRRPWWEGIWLSPFILGARIAASVLTAPRAWGYMWANWWDSINYPTDREKLKRKEEGYFNSEFTQRAFYGASNFALFPVRAVTQPAIQAFGTAAWEMMKRRADLLLTNRLPKNDYSDEGAAWILMNELKKRIPMKDGKPVKGLWQTEDKDEGRVEITLVGHSMGALVIDRILLQFPDIDFKRIIYLAPANSIEDFETFVLPYLSNHHDTEFSTWSLKPTDEAQELNFVLLDQRTLLVWIDNFFENVTTRRQLRFGEDKNLKGQYFRRGSYILDFLYGAATEKVELITFTGEEGDAIYHGDFGKPNILGRILCTADPNAFQPRCPHPYTNKDE